MNSKEMIRVEFRHTFHGNAVISIDGQDNIDCSRIDTHVLFYEKASKRIRDQYIDSCTIFMLGKKQVDKINKYFTRPHH